MNTTHELPGFEEVSKFAVKLLRDLKDANGAKRTRTIHAVDVAEVLREAADDGYATTGRQAVASCYGYPADYVACDVVACGDFAVAKLARQSCSRSTPLGVSAWSYRWRVETIYHRRRELVSLALVTARAMSPAGLLMPARALRTIAALVRAFA